MLLSVIFNKYKTFWKFDFLNCCKGRAFDPESQDMGQFKTESIICKFLIQRLIY